MLTRAEDFFGDVYYTLSGSCCISSNVSFPFVSCAKKRKPSGTYGSRPMLILVTKKNKV